MSFGLLATPAPRNPARAHSGPFAVLASRPALWLAMLAFVLYLPPALSVIQLNADVVEHVDIARRLAAGQGYQLGIKGYFIGAPEVVHNGLEERSPLYPLLGAGLLRLGLGLPAFQVLNAALAAGCVALVCLIGSELFGRRTGLLAGLLAAASPPVLIFMVPPMTEALALCLTLLATWLLVRDLEAPRAASFAAAGVALGLGYLTRPTTGAMAAALLLGVLLASRNRRALLRPLGVLLVGLVVFAVLITLYSLATRGSPSYSGQSYLYAVLDDDEIGEDPYHAPLASPLQFVVANHPAVLAATVRNVRAYAARVFLDWRWLLLLLPAWPAVLLALVRGRYPRAAWPVLLLAAVNFFIYALTWANHQPRYQLLTLLLLLPFAVDGLTRLGLARLRLPTWPGPTLLHIVVLAIGLIWLQTLVQEYRGQFRYSDEAIESRVDYGVRWTGPPAWVRLRDLRQTVDWINTQTEPGDVLAQHTPWIPTFFTGRPSTRLPHKLDDQSLRRFLTDYRVAYVVLNTDDYRRRYQEPLRQLAVAGVRGTTLGDQVIFDTRALWR